MKLMLLNFHLTEIKILNFKYQDSLFHYNFSINFRIQGDMYHGDLYHKDAILT